MVAGKVKQAMGLQKSPSPNPNPKPKPPPPPSKPPSPSPSSGSKTSTKSNTVFNRSFGAYFPRASAQVQPKPPDVPDLLKLIEDLRDRESRLKTELVEQKLLRETAAIVPVLENDIVLKGNLIETLKRRVCELEIENARLINEREVIKNRFEGVIAEKERRIADLEKEMDDLKQLSSSQRFQGLIEVSGKSNLIKNLSFRKSSNVKTLNSAKQVDSSIEGERPCHSRCSSTDEILEASESTLSAIAVPSKQPRVPKPPPKPRSSHSLTSSSASSSSECRKSTDSVTTPPPPPPPPPPATKSAPMPPPPPPMMKRTASQAHPPPPPPPPVRVGKAATNNVKRVPEVVEFYHSLMRRDSRRDSSAGASEVTAASAKDLVGEIENRSAYLLAIKTDVETQGEFIRFLIKEVETAGFTDIEDVLSFVKWLDDELSYLVDERAVLKHFKWPEQKADALREAAFEYCDLKKLQTEASSFRDDPRQPCASVLKKMQTLLEKLEHGVYNLSRLRESASNRFKSFQIPVDWMLDTGFVSQIKLASVKLAMKYMRRVSAELEAAGGGPEEEELIVQGVRFAFRVHQFAGGFDVETMRAFEELRDKARSCHVQCQNQQQHQPHRLLCRSMLC